MFFYLIELLFFLLSYLFPFTNYLSHHFISLSSFYFSLIILFLSHHYISLSSFYFSLIIIFLSHHFISLSHSLQSSEDKELPIIVYNCTTRLEREVILIPTRKWAGEGTKLNKMKFSFRYYFYLTHFSLFISSLIL